MKICAGRFTITHMIDSAWRRDHNVVGVYNVFVFDPERRFYRFSLPTPNTECWHVRHGLEFSPDATDSQREAAFKEASTWKTDEVFYVDSVPAFDHERRLDDETVYVDAMMEAVKWHNSNHVL